MNANQSLTLTDNGVSNNITTGSNNEYFRITHRLREHSNYCIEFLIKTYSQFPFNQFWICKSCIFPKNPTPHPYGGSKNGMPDYKHPWSRFEIRAQSQEAQIGKSGYWPDADTVNIQDIVFDLVFVVNSHKTQSLGFPVLEEELRALYSPVNQPQLLPEPLEAQLT